MTFSRLALPLVAALATACAPSHEKPAPTIPPRAAVLEPPLPNGPDIADQLMGVVTVADGARLLQQLTPGAPDAAAAVDEFARGVGLDPALARVVDLRRPLAIAMLNPGLLASPTVRPYVALVPVTSRADVERVIAAKVPASSMARAPWGFALSTTAGHVLVGFQRGYAVIAWREDLLAPAMRLLGARLARRLDAPVVLHLDVDNLYSAYGPQVDAIVGQLARLAETGGGAGDPQVAFALRGVRNVLSYTKSVKALDLLADLDSGGLTLTARVDGKQNGAWASFVQQQRPGPAWGVRFLPRDAVLVYSTHASPDGRRNDLEASVEYLADALPAKNVTPDQRDRWRAVLARAVASTGGELAYAVWPAKGGGVGIGGAYRLSDPAMAREAVNAAYDELAQPLVGLVLRQLSLDPQRFASRVSVKRSAAQIGGMPADLVEVSVRWPAGSDSERHAFEAMFGPKLVLATAFVGDAALFAVGADYAERLGTMVAVARGEQAASMGDEPSFAEALAFHERGRVSFSYLETARMAQFAATLMAETQELGPTQRQALAALFSDVGRGAIVSTTNASGSRYELTTHLPPAAVAGAARLHGALWRIALSPLFNPPMMPPMPVPPQNVTPTVPAPQGSTL